MNSKADKGISDIVGALADPVIVTPGGWGDSLPKWLKEAIPLERLAMNMRALKGEEATGTDAEACAYLMTASLSAPMAERWTRIYLHVAGQMMRRHQQVEVPADILVETLDAYDAQELARLKTWIYYQRVRSRRERDRGERREERQAQRDEQQSLFDM